MVKRKNSIFRHVYQHFTISDYCGIAPLRRAKKLSYTESQDKVNIYAQANYSGKIYSIIHACS